MTVWHVCGTPARPPTTAHSDRLTLGTLTRDFMSAPSAIRTRDLLLRRQSLYPLSYRGCSATRLAAPGEPVAARRVGRVKPSRSPAGFAPHAARARLPGPATGCLYQP